ncbi:MAG: ABC transporter permease [Phycisphaerae bacterium]|nr:ABC transporter permease [Gemmatimonadaceae bacterium]
MRLYQLLLLLYPKSFRNEYSPELVSIFRARLRDHAGFFARLGLYLETIADVVRNALASHADILQQDLRFTFRALRRAPAFTTAAIVVTALGIGANTAAFSIVDFVFLRQLPYADADRLLKVSQTEAGGGAFQQSPALYREWSTSARTFLGVGAYFLRAVNLVGDGEPQRIERAVVTSTLLPLLGVQPFRGRLFTIEEERTGSNSVVISHALWQSQFGGDEDIIGRRLLLDGNPGVVIGIMPATFNFPSRDIALWSVVNPETASDDDHNNHYWNAVARLRPAVSVAQASAELTALLLRLERSLPDSYKKPGASMVRLRDEFSAQSRLLLYALLGAAACVLLIACANLANLLLARALTRHREMLVRSAMGAGRERLVRQSITESLVLAAAGGSLGVTIAYAALPLLTRLVPTTLPIAQSPSIDTRIILFALGLTALTGLGFGVLPAWRAAGSVDLSGLRDGNRAGGGRRERARSALVVAEVMASVVLLISAGLLMRALLRVQNVDPGFRTENVLTMRTALPLPKYDSTVTRAAYYRGVLEQVRSLPGVASAAFITGLPMSMQGGMWPVVPEDQPLLAQHPPSASSRFVTPGYFGSIGIPLKRGRDIAESDNLSQPYVAVVSESFVKKFWPGQDPIGKRFKFLNDVRTVVGVVGDVHMRGPEQSSEPQVYASHQQVQNGQSNFYYPKDLVIRSSLPQATLIPMLRSIVRRVDPQQPISHIRTLSEIVSDVTAARSVQVRVLGAFALIAFLLAAGGIHGLLAFTVSQRQREIGVRMALGAQRGEIVRMVMRRGVLLGVAGVVPGIVIAYAAGRAMQSLLAGVNPGDGLTFGAVVILCGVMTIVGSLLPVLRAIRVDPATAFRAD